MLPRRFPPAVLAQYHEGEGLDYTRWDCVSFVDKEACDLMGPFYTWGSC